MATTLQAGTQTAPTAVIKGDPQRSPLTDVLAYLFLGLLAVFFLFPLAWMMLSSLKTGQDIATSPLVYEPSALSIDSYGAMLVNVPLLAVFMNTLSVDVFKAGLELFLSHLAGYTFAKHRF